MPKCFRIFDFIQYDGTNGGAVLSAIASREMNSEVTWTLLSDDGETLVLNWHGDQNQPYEFRRNQYVVFDGDHWEWSGMPPMDPALFAERYGVV
jgi:hypothetical protein